ncbi:hypothetical protein PQX77_017333 [Marasmius sp. AFHP31]|nr:hypothetical protein PQX77_017333 [Marasmius sp. AFHP31]
MLTRPSTSQSGPDSQLVNSVYLDLRTTGLIECDPRFPDPTVKIMTIPSQEGQKRKASAGMIVGIVFGVIAATIILVVLGVTLMRWRRRAEKQRKQLRVAPFYGGWGTKANANGIPDPESQTVIDSPSRSVEKRLPELPALAPVRYQPIRSTSVAVNAGIPDPPSVLPPLPPLRRETASSEREEALQKKVDTLLRENALLMREIYPPSYRIGSSERITPSEGHGP